MADDAKAHDEQHDKAHDRPKDDARGDRDAKQNEKKPEPVSGVEWAAAGLGLALLLGTVGALVREAATSEGRAPDVLVRVDSVSRGRGGYVAHYTARNGGDATAAALTLRATLAAPGDTLEREAQVDYLPARSERRGGFVFPRDPREPGAGALRVEAVGYEEP